MKKKAVILFSGGLDSTTCLAMAKAEGFECYALSFDYGQKHNSELERAKELATLFGVMEHKVVPLPLHEWGGSSLNDSKLSVKDHNEDGSIPNTYVPARNTIFLALTLGYAEVLGAFDIYIGINAVDYSQYPDCRPEYLKAFENLAKLATKVGVEGADYKIHAPLLHLKKAEIIRAGIDLGVDYSVTVSCYRADTFGRACGNCDSCAYRKKGFMEAGVTDPTVYF
ncbi:MAG: 7-cyano-7-deazaguanine synthase QueC [Gammaproteobacteria bacterium]|nr:7-cyano-7-deazaguanine synthase QueC [Gammaproteobacteria bacterium]